MKKKKINYVTKRINISLMQLKMRTRQEERSYLKTILFPIKNLILFFKIANNETKFLPNKIVS